VVIGSLLLVNSGEPVFMLSSDVVPTRAKV
jgi:hypothetical protein